MEEKITIRRLEPQDEKAFIKAALEWDHVPGFTWTTPAEGQSFSDFIHFLGLNEKGIDLPAGYVPATILCGFIGDDLAARVNLRHTLNDFLLKVGGHIGYGVIPSYRRKGVATAMLQGALKECVNLGLRKVLVTCDDDNIASVKTIESANGVLENILNSKRRYWISL